MLFEWVNLIATVDATLFVILPAPLKADPIENTFISLACPTWIQKAPWVIVWMMSEKKAGDPPKDILHSHEVVFTFLTWHR